MELPAASTGGAVGELKAMTAAKAPTTIRTRSTSGGEDTAKHGAISRRRGGDPSSFRGRTPLFAICRPADVHEARIARQTLCAVSGMSRWRTPSGRKRIEHGVGERRRRAVGRQLADALQAEEVVGRGRGDGLDPEIGHVVGARQGIIHQGAAQQLAGLLVVDGLLHQRVAQPMHDAAMHLAGQQARIHDDPAIGDRGQAIDPHAAGLGIDLDLADHDAGGEGFDLVAEQRVAFERLAGRQLEQADAAVGADDLEGAVAIGDVGRRRLEPLGGQVAAALDHHVGRALERRAADDGRGGAAGAAAVRDGARVALADLDALDRHAERLRQDLREHRLVALALALRADARHQPVGPDLDHDMLVGDAAGAVEMAREAEAAPLARRLAGGAPAGEARFVGRLQRRLEQPRAVRGVVGVAARRRVGHLVGPEQVEAAQVGRRAAGLVGGDVDQAFEQEQRLGLAGAADGVDRHGVGEGAVEVDADRRDAVEAGDHLGEARGRDGRREHRDIGAVVGLGLDAECEELAVGIERQLRARHKVAGMAVALRQLGAFARPAQAALELARRPGDQGRIRHRSDTSARSRRRHPG